MFWQKMKSGKYLSSIGHVNSAFCSLVRPFCCVTRWVPWVLRLQAIIESSLLGVTSLSVDSELIPIASILNKEEELANKDMDAN